MENYRIVEKPLITEKSTRLLEEGNWVCFRVNPDANKIQIKKAVEELFKVNVTKVRTMRIPGKNKRVRLQIGRTPEWKKAIITLKQGEQIELF